MMSEGKTRPHPSFANLDSDYSSAKVSVVIVNYNGREHLKECLSSVLGQSYTNFEAILVDNFSTDRSADYVRRNFPEVKVVKNSDNLGYGGGNNIGFEIACGEYIAVLNPDTVVEEDWLKGLVTAIQQRPDVKMATSKVLLYHHPKRINACGNEIHFTGLVSSRGLGERDDHYAEEEYVFAPSGCSFLIPRILIEEIGSFDTEFSYHWLYEDTDLAMRLQLRGYKCIFTPSSRVYHKYVLKMSSLRYFMLERGRYLIMLKNLSRRLLTILIFSLILTEILTWGFAMLEGRDYMIAKIVAYKWIVKNKQKILAKRKRIQEFKKIGDKELIRRFSYQIHIPKLWMSNEGARRALEMILNFLYRVFHDVTLYLLTY